MIDLQNLLHIFVAPEERETKIERMNLKKVHYVEKKPRTL